MMVVQFAAQLRFNCGLFFSLRLRLQTAASNRTLKPHLQTAASNRRTPFPPDSRDRGWQCFCAQPELRAVSQRASSREQACHARISVN